MCFFIIVTVPKPPVNNDRFARICAARRAQAVELPALRKFPPPESAPAALSAENVLFHRDPKPPVNNYLPTQNCWNTAFMTDSPVSAPHAERSLSNFPYHANIPAQSRQLRSPAEDVLFHYRDDSKTTCEQLLAHTELLEHRVYDRFARVRAARRVQAVELPVSCKHPPPERASCVLRRGCVFSLS